MKDPCNTLCVLRRKTCNGPKTSGKCFPFQGTLNQHLRKNHPGVTEGRGRMESPERTDVYGEQKLESDASASEMALDSRLEIHTVSDAPD